MGPGRAHQSLERDQPNGRSSRNQRESSDSPFRPMEMPGADEGDDEDGDLSDYIDENFEPDETDEYWGVTQRVARPFHAHLNDLNEVT